MCWRKSPIYSYEGESSIIVKNIPKIEMGYLIWLD